MKFRNFSLDIKLYPCKIYTVKLNFFLFSSCGRVRMRLRFTAVRVSFPCILLSGLGFFTMFCVPKDVRADYDYNNSVANGDFETFSNWTGGYNGTQKDVNIRVGFNAATSAWTPVITLNNAAANYTTGGIILGAHQYTRGTLVINAGKLSSYGDLYMAVGNARNNGTSSVTDCQGTITVNAAGTLDILNNKAVYLGGQSLEVKGTLTSNYTGTINVNGGKVTAGSGEWLLGSTVSGTFSNTGNLNITAGGTVTTSGKFSLAPAGNKSYGNIKIDGADSKLSCTVLNLASTAGGNAVVTVSGGGTLDVTANSEQIIGGAGTASLAVSGNDTTVNVGVLRVGKNAGGSGSVTVAGGTLNLLNRNGTGWAASSSQFSNGGAASFTQTGGVTNCYSEIFTGEGANNAALTVTYSLSGGTFNLFGWDKTRGTSATDYTKIGGGRFCLASHANGLLTISGNAVVNMNSEFVMTWQNYNGTVNQTGGTANLWGGLRTVVGTGASANALGRYGIIFSNLAPSDGGASAAYNLSGGTLNTYRLSSCNAAAEASLNVSGGTAVVKYDSGIDASGQLEVAAKQTGGSVTVPTIQYTNSSFATGNAIYGYYLSAENAANDAASTLNAETLFLDNNSSSGTKKVQFFQAGGVSTFADSASTAATAGGITVTKGADFTVAGGTANLGVESVFSTASTLTLTGGRTNITKNVEINSGSNANLSGNALLVSAWSTGKDDIKAEVPRAFYIGRTDSGTMSLAGTSQAYISALSVGGTAINTQGTLNIRGNSVMNLVNSSTNTGYTPTTSYFGNSGKCVINITENGTLNNYAEIYSSELNKASTVEINIDGGTFNHWNYDKQRAGTVSGLASNALYGGGRFCLAANGTGTINLKDGEFNSYSEFVLAWGNNGAKGVFNQTGGTAVFGSESLTTSGKRYNLNGSVNNDFGYALNFSGNGSQGSSEYNLQNGSMTAVSMGRKNTKISSKFNVSGGTADIGTLAVNTLLSGGEFSAEAVNITTNTVIDGSWTAPATFYQTGGTLSPSLTGIGTMTFASAYAADGNIDVHIDYNPATKTSDRIAFQSTADFSDSNLLLTLDMNNTQISPEDVLTFDVFDFMTGSTPSAAQNVSVNMINFTLLNPETVASFDVSRLFTAGEITMTSSLPEPAAWLILALGGVFLGISRRKTFRKNA